MRGLGSLAFEGWKLVRMLQAARTMRNLTKIPAEEEAITKSIVRHVQTTLARQAYNIDDVSFPILLPQVLVQM